MHQQIAAAAGSPLSLAFLISAAVAGGTVLASPMREPIQPPAVCVQAAAALPLGTDRAQSPAEAPQKGGPGPETAPAAPVRLASASDSDFPATVAPLKAYKAIPDLPKPDERGLVVMLTSAGLRYVVRAQVADRFQKLVGWLEAKGYRIKEIGCFARRRIERVGSWSDHARATACDINPKQNPVTYGTARTDLPKGVGDFARSIGLRWGALWRGPKKDSMHFAASDSHHYAIVGGAGRRRHASR